MGLRNNNQVQAGQLLLFCANAAISSLRSWASSGDKLVQGGCLNGCLWSCLLLQWTATAKCGRCPAVVPPAPSAAHTWTVTPTWTGPWRYNDAPINVWWLVHDNWSLDKRQGMRCMHGVHAIITTSKSVPDHHLSSTVHTALADDLPLTFRSMYHQEVYHIVSTANHLQ